tara:strand:+ start:76 stop:570 length:495 start_codon:yes stop_codon:yes gene_type:complete
MTRVWSNIKTESWTQAEVKTMMAMLDAGSRMEAIARVLKRSRNSVIGKSNRERAKRKVEPEPVPKAPPPVVSARLYPKRVRVRGVYKERKPAPRESKLRQPVAFKELPPTPPLSLCQYIAGHPAEGDMSYCEKPIRKGAPYCPDHAAKCLVTYVRPKLQPTPRW